MKGLKKVTEKIEITINYWVSRHLPAKGIYRGCVAKPKYLDEIWINVREDTVFDFELDDFRETGKKKLAIYGTDRAYEELGKYFIALSRYQTEDPAYHDHFDGMQDFNGDVMVNLEIQKERKDN